MSGTHSDLPIWLQWIQAMSVPLLGFVAGYVAYQQWRTADRKVQIDLFDRRLVIIDQIKHAMNPIVREGSASLEDLRAYSTAIDKSKFFFGNEVTDRLFKTRMHINDLMCHIDEMKKGPPYPRESIDGKYEYLQHIVKLYSELTEIFEPYMRLDHKVQPSVSASFRRLRKALARAAT